MPETLAFVGARESGILVRMQLYSDVPPVPNDRFQIPQIVPKGMGSGDPAAG